MPGLILRPPWRQQPQQPVPVDRADRFGKAAEVVFSFGGGGAERISGRTASANTSAQAVNGRGRAAQFNGAQQFLFDKTEAYSGPYLIAAITQADTAAGGVGNVASGINIAAGYSWQLRSNGSTWEFYHLDGSSSNVLAAESGGVIAGLPTVLVGLWDGANIKFLRNGVLRATTATTTQIRAVDRISLGYDGASAGQFFTGSVNEAVLFRGVFSTADAIELSQNLYRVFQAPARRIWVSAGAPAGTTYNVSIAETASAVDTLSAILAGLASIAETGTASDASSAALIGTAVVTEAGTAADSQAASAVFVAARSDVLAAADTTSTGGAITSAAVAETAVATDSTSAIATFLTSVAEIGAALDSQSATTVLNAAWSDALNAADSQNWGGSVISVSLSEALNALDSQSASAVFAASVTESSAALDSTSCILIANASISEVLAALDSSSVQLITSASIAEALNALDTTSVVNLNFIAAASHILVGRARVTVLVGKSRVLVIY